VNISGNLVAPSTGKKYESSRGKKCGTWYRKDLQVNSLKLATVGKISKVQGRKAGD
jgi:hypothetical protein